MKFLIGSALALTLFIGQEAQASCDGKEFSAKDAAVQLSTLNSYFVKKEYQKVQTGAKSLEENLPCMRTPAPPQVFATAYRYIGVGYYLEGNEVLAKRWFRTSLELNPNHKWGVSEVKTSEPLYNLYEEARNDAVVDIIPIEGKQLTSPEGTVVYVDGRVWKEAGLTPDRPHIVFIASRADRHIISRFTTDGNQLPELVLEKSDPVNKKKSQEISAEDMFAVTEIKRIRPPSKTPLLISSLATLGAAGGVYGYTFTTNQQFFDANTTANKDALRKKNNGLLVTSIAIGTLGLGVGYAGMIIDAPSSPIGIPWQL